MENFTLLTRKKQLAAPLNEQQFMRSDHWWPVVNHNIPILFNQHPFTLLQPQHPLISSLQEQHFSWMMNCL